MKLPGEQRTSIRIVMSMSMAGLALALSAAPDASAASIDGGPTYSLAPAGAAFITVYGDQTYTPGVGGFQGGYVPYFPGSGANSAGTAVGQAEKFDASGASFGHRGAKRTFLSFCKEISNS